MRMIWTADAEAYLRDHPADGAPSIAEALGCSVLAVNTRASKLHIRLGRCAPERRREHPDRFVERVEFDLCGGCWLWTGYLKASGYGDFDGYGAHRAAWRIFRGPIPGGMFVCHRCDIPACVNPDHLFLGTADDNNKDKVSKGRQLIGSKQAAAKITEADAAEIIRLLHERVSVTEIAAQIGCSRQTITNIQCNGAWSHVGTPPPPLGRSESMSRARKKAERESPRPRRVNGQFARKIPAHVDPWGKSRRKGAEGTR